MASSYLRSRLDEAKARLTASLPWSPHDFVRGISSAGDRAIQIAAIVRDLDDDNDLRVIHSIADTDVAVCAERLPWDSAFFGYDVARLHGIFPLKRNGYALTADYTPAVQSLVRLAASRGIRYLFAAVDSRDLPTLRALGAAGFALVETRCYFYRSLRDYQFPRRFACRLATAADLESLVEVARRVGNPYDRFHADPFIGRPDAIRLMETWIRASILDGFADAAFVPDRPHPSAVCTLKYHRDKWPAWGVSIAQIALALADPQAAGSFVRVFSEMNYHLQAIEVDHVFFSTQMTNRPVIRAGERLGYRLGKGEHVLRLIL